MSQQSEKSQKFVEIDGSFLEGGGQILRNALSFSCILRRPVRITKIRANRSTPGLSNQHLFGLNLLQEITGARVSGNVLRSTEVEFEPGHIRSGNYHCDCKTAASITLVLQAALPVLAFGANESQLELIGGTNVAMAPQVDYMTEVLRPNLEQMGITFDFDLLQRGYFPRGGGRCIITIPYIEQYLDSINLIQLNRINEVNGWCFVAGRLPLQLAEDMKAAVHKELEKVESLTQKHIRIEAYKETNAMARDNGAGVVLRAQSSSGCTLGSAALGGGKQMDGHSLGHQAANKLAQYLKMGICIDENLQDQLILFMTLAKGESHLLTCPLTNHTRTAIHVAQLMAPTVKFNIEERDGGQVIIHCHGIGHKNEH